MKALSECMLLTIALATLVWPALARTLLNCDTAEVIITSEAGSSKSVQTSRRLSFWADDASKTLTFADGGPLRITRFDPAWIDADHDDMQYDFDRSDGTLTYASSISEDSGTRTIVGSGHCQSTPNLP
jgi:hypothetical protein